MTFRHGYDSVFGAFTQSVADHGDRPFLHAPAAATADYAGAAISYTYSSANVAVRNLKSAYLDRNIGAGDRVAVAYDSRIDVYLHLLALNAIGASMVPLNTTGSDEEIRYVVEHSDSKMLVAASMHVQRLSGVMPGLHVEDGDGLVGSAPQSDVAVGTTRTEAALLYTSGTTGKPKGCMLSNDYFLSIGAWYNSLGGICALGSSDRLMTPLPPNHMNALATSFMAMMMCGGCVIQVDRFHPSTWWQTARDEKVTVIHCLGVMVAILLTLPEEAADDFSKQIKFCFGPGSDPRHQSVFEQRFGFPLVEAWAMTETGAGAITIANKEPRHVGKRCIGTPTSATEIRIVDEQDNDVGAGQDGELLVRCKGDDPRAMFFSGYYKDDTATAEAWKDDWFHTGDVVRQGEDGSLYFVDRRKNVIRRSGENIAAVEVEAVLLQHEYVTNCAVCAVPDEIRGDEVFAFVVVAGDQLDAGALFEHCMQHLAYFKAPGYIALVDELPLTASQKISRGDVKKMARASIDDNSCSDMRDSKRRTISGPSGSKTTRPGLTETTRPSSSKTTKPRLSKTTRPRLTKSVTPRMGYDGIVVTAPVSIPYERFSPEPAHWWLARVLQKLGSVSGLTAADVDGLCASSFSLFPDTAVGLTQHFGLTLRWLDHVPTGGASGIVTLRRAARAVQSGDASVVACIAGDTNHVDSFRAMLTSFSRFSQDASYPYGSGGPNGSFALMTAHHMNTYGTRAEDLGKLCVAQRENALHYAGALMKKPLTIDEYLDARLIADPLRLYDCVMPCAGGEGYLVMRESDARSLQLPYAHILSTIERHNAFPDDPIQIRGGWELDRDEFWDMSGIGPGDVDLLQTYDDYPIISAMQFEDLGFCDKGAVSEFIQNNSFTTDGSFPHNTSGGQLSVGQAGAAGGFLGLVEAIRQVTGIAGDNAVPEANIAAVSGFGMINFDRGLCSGAAILQGQQ